MHAARLFPVLALSLVACDKIDLPFGDDDEAGEVTEAKVIEAPAEPLDLYVTNATINMITVKNGETEVPGKFSDVQGVLTFADADQRTDLQGALTIGLGSWDSGLGVRDERVQSLFFDVANNKTATFTLDRIEGLPEAGIAVGHEATGTAYGRVYVAGGRTDVEAPVKLSRSGEAEYHIDTTEPFTVSIESIGLMEPLKELMRVCEHKSIDDSVKVSARIDLGPTGTARPVEPEVEKKEATRRQPTAADRQRVKAIKQKAKRKAKNR